MTPASVLWHDSLPSAQDEAHRLAAGGAPHGLAVAAREQTSGRGTRGRAWASGRGGLWISVVCRPRAGPATEVIGLRVGLAIANLLDPMLPAPLRVALKWPNDLYLGQKKFGGILTEARWQGESLGWMVIGTGINLRNEIPAELTDTATRMEDAGVRLEPAALATLVAPSVAEAARDAAPLTAAELAAFEDRDWLRGRAITVPSEGIAEGITAAGRLRVRSAGGALTEVVAPVQLARQA